MKTDRPSMLRILQTDYVTFLVIVFPIAVWAIYLYLNFTQPTQNTSLLFIGIGVTIAAIPIFILRSLFFFKIYRTGEETAATVQGIFFYRSRGRVRYNFIFKGVEYRGGNPIMKTSRTRQLTAGQQVTILVDPNNPKKAVIKHLYE